MPNMTILRPESIEAIDESRKFLPETPEEHTTKLVAQKSNW